MQCEYDLNENDFLVFQLYSASKSPIIRKKRIMNKVIVPVVYILLGIPFVFLESYLTAYLFILIGVLWFFLFPLYERQRYVKYYGKYIRENFKERFGRHISITFEKDFIYSRDTLNEGKTSTSEIAGITEIPQLILVKLKTGQSVILPVNKISNIIELRDCLRSMASTLQIKYDPDSQWRWK
jgi:hypothetical protein